MNMFLRNLTATLLGLLSLSSVASADFTPIAGWDNQLFPSYLIATATLKSDPSTETGNTLGDPDGQLGVLVKATKDNQEVTVTIRCDEFMEASEFHGVLPKAGETYTINPKPAFASIA